MNTFQDTARLLTDDQLEDMQGTLIGVGRLRKSVADQEPGTLADLTRINENARAIEALALIAANLMADGAIYINRDAVFLRVEPTGQLRFTELLQVEGFLLWVDAFQCWIDAIERVVVTGVAADREVQFNPIQGEAVKRLEEIEDAAGPAAVQAYRCWINEWARKNERSYPLCAVGGTPTKLRIPSSSRLHAAVRNRGKGDKPTTSTVSVVQSVVPMFLVRTVTGQTFLTYRDAATSAMVPASEIRYSRSSRTQDRGWPLRSMKLKNDT